MTQTRDWGLVAGMWALSQLAVSHLPPLGAVAIPPLLALLAGFVAQPAAGLLAVLFARVAVDLLWWTNGLVFGLNLMELFSGGIAALALVLLAVDPRDTARHPYFVPFLPFLAVLLFAAVRAGDPRTAAEVAARFISPVLLMFLVGAHFQARHIRTLLLGLPLAALLPVVLGYYHLATGQMSEMTLDGYARLRGAYANIHNHAHAMALFAALSMPHLTHQKGWKRSAATALLAATIGLLALTYVRTAAVGLAVFLLSFLLLERRFRLAAASIAVLMLIVFASSIVQDRFADIATLLTADADEAATGKVGSGRIALWTEAFYGWWSETSLDVVVGVGLDGQRNLNHLALDAHNDYLSLLFQVGPIGLLSYLSFHLLVARASWALRQTSDPEARSLGNLVLALTAMVITDNLLSNSYINRIHIAWLFWAVCGTVFAMRRNRHFVAVSSANEHGPSTYVQV